MDIEVEYLSDFKDATLHFGASLMVWNKGVLLILCPSYVAICCFIYSQYIANLHFASPQMLYFVTQNGSLPLLLNKDFYTLVLEGDSYDWLNSFYRTYYSVFTIINGTETVRSGWCTVFSIMQFHVLTDFNLHSDWLLSATKRGWVGWNKKIKWRWGSEGVWS